MKRRRGTNRSIDKRNGVVIPFPLKYPETEEIILGLSPQEVEYRPFPSGTGGYWWVKGDPASSNHDDPDSTTPDNGRCHP